MLYPIEKEDEMKWAFAPMVEIPENMRKKYPDGKGGFYERKIDTDNPIIYKDFINGISYINESMKKLQK